MAIGIEIDASNSNPVVPITQMQSEVPVYQHKSITATGETLRVVREVAAAVLSVNYLNWRASA